MSSLLQYRFFKDTFSSEYELLLSAWGDGVLSEDALLDFEKPDTIINIFKKRFRRYPKDISLFIEDPRLIGLNYCNTGVDTALLEKLETLKELILPDSITHIDMTEKLQRILEKNNTLIRGNFDSYAQEFARENNLNFRPADLIFAEYYFERTRESTRMTLVFKRGGGVYMKEAITAPGSNAGNTSGGTLTHPLDRDFYKTKTAEQITEKLSDALRRNIIEDGRLAAFIEKAKTHGYYTGKN